MFNRKGQNIAEYSILIALVIAAAVAMQTYVKRGIQGRVADAVDHAPATDLVAGSAIEFTTKQYEPYYLDSSTDVQSTRDLQEDLSARGGVDRTGVDEETRRLTGSREGSSWDGFERDDYDAGRP